MSAQPVLEIRDLYKSFGKLEVLKGISLEVRVGEVIALIGSSGSGKSTLLRCINFFGETYQRGYHLSGKAHRLGFTYASRKDESQKRYPKTAF